VKKPIPDFVATVLWAVFLVAVLIPLVPLHHQSLLGWLSSAAYHWISGYAGRTDFIEGVADFCVGAAFLLGSGFLAAGLIRGANRLLQ
jgi:hypothetical protein